MTYYLVDEKEIQKAERGFFGKKRGKLLILSLCEAAYLKEFKGFDVRKDGKSVKIEEIYKDLVKKRKLQHYLAYRDWRNRGLIALPGEGKGERKEGKIYKAKPLDLKGKLKILEFDKKGLLLLGDYDRGKELYSKYWIGQLGAYKKPHMGKNYILDIYEGVFLEEKGFFSLGAREIGEKRIKHFREIYQVYKEWRERGYVVKTGFKFGCHFRVYEPGVKPTKKTLHSKHVLHVFPEGKMLLASEWSRTVRVAHGVRKTFILAIPQIKGVKEKKPAFLLYHRHGNIVLTPQKGKPSYYLFVLAEDEKMDGKTLLSMVKKCERDGLGMLLAIVDREGGITYYNVKRVTLEGSESNYFEIEWLQP